MTGRVSLQQARDDCDPESIFQSGQRSAYSNLQRGVVSNPWREALKTMAAEECGRATTHCHSVSNNPGHWCGSCRATFELASIKDNTK